MSEPATGVPGLKLKGRYVIEKELGRGGIGVVYLARDEQLHSRPVVIKVLLDQTAGTEWFQKHFRGEIEALVRIDHPGVVGALDAGEMPDGKPFLVMQYVPGGNLRSLMKGQLLDVPVIADVVRQVGSALSAAHEAGVHHRDLKPENIMVKDQGHGERQVKIIDFGIATVRDPAEAGTQMTQVAGSVLYMAPEQLMGRPGAGSDIFALAVIAYELLAGEAPFRPQSPFELLGVQRAGVQRKPSELRPGLSPVVDTVVLKGLALEPKERQATARQFGEELHAALLAAAAHAPTQRDLRSTEALGPAPLPLGAMPTAGPRPATERGGPPPRPTPPPTSSRMPLIAGGAAVLVAVLVGGAIALRPPAPPSPSPSLSVTTPPPAAAANGPQLAYYLTVQRFQDGRPHRDPFRLAQEMLFGPQEGLRVSVAAQQPGYLYVVNEGPGRSGAIIYNVLHPKTTVDGGSAALDAGREVHIPAPPGYLRFDEAQGTENLWFVFGAQPVPELEAVKGAANPQDRGTIKDAARLEGLRAFLDRHRGEPPQRTEDAGAQRTLLRASSPVLVGRVKLEHR